MIKFVFKMFDSTYAVKMAEKLKQSLRSGDIIARIGGDEFVVMIKSNFGLECAVIVAQKLNSEGILKKVDAAMYCSK